jgi:hypothetical protein
MLIEIVGFLHLSFAIVASFYAFLFKKSWIDYLFIFYILITMLSWTFYNGECLITYQFKKKEDPNYIAGENSNDMKDMYIIIPNTSLANTIVVVKFFFHLLSEFIVLSRNKFPTIICYLLPAIHFSYSSSLYVFEDVYQNNTFLVFQEVCKILILLILFYSLKRILKL